jgi:hypothetical protein
MKKTKNDMKKAMSGDKIMPLYIEDSIYSIDIDTKVDLMVAKVAMKFLEENRK